MKPRPSTSFCPGPIMSKRADLSLLQTPVGSTAQELFPRPSWIKRFCQAAAAFAPAARRTGPELPSFFVIGPPRTGSSWLHEVLQGRVVLPTPTKETRFFDIHFHRGIKWYRAHFPHCRERLEVGEVAPTYFASTQAREHIARVIPKARVVCVFRNPVERLLSLYRLKRAYGMIPWNLEQAISLDPELLESSRYATHLRAWQQALGTDQVLPTVYDDLCDQPQSFVDTLADFIGVGRFALTPSQMQYVFASESMTLPRSYYCTHRATAMAEWLKGRRLDGVVTTVKRSPFIKLFLGGGVPFLDLPREASASLYECLRAEVDALETLLNRDLSPWKAPRAQRSTMAAD